MEQAKKQYKRFYYQELLIEKVPFDYFCDNSFYDINKKHHSKKLFYPGFIIKSSNYLMIYFYNSNIQDAVMSIKRRPFSILHFYSNNEINYNYGNQTNNNGINIFGEKELNSYKKVISVFDNKQGKIKLIYGKIKQKVISFRTVN